MRTPVCLVAVVQLGTVLACATAEPHWIAPQRPDAAATSDRPCPLLRGAFTLADQPTKATVRVIGLGHYELRLNG
ncbi:MAG TPA: hypothetical protein PLQ87_01175, partial [Phycisphaerae bacterium]|nr:hypothetical protein [Phycisphaerae bacterium]